MALRVPWDKQETALLIDAYLRVKNEELSQQEAIKEVSSLLRRRAILSGMEIDDVFRNINGITMQMKIISSLIDDRPSSLHSATKMFNDMVALYKSDPAAFYEILIQVKGECALQVNVQEKFFAWLTEKVSSAQLSEFNSVCKDIESFCMSKRILTQPLFETTNTVLIQEVIDTIKANRMFRFKYFHQLGKMHKVMDYYRTFLSEVPLQQFEEPEIVSVIEKETISEEFIESQNTVPSDKTSELEIVQHEVIVSVIEDKSISAENVGSIEVVVKDEAVMTEDNDREAIIWNFANENVDFANTNPTIISYFGDEEKVQGWVDAFVKIICAMQEDYPSIVRGMVGYRFVDVGKVVLTGIAGFDRFSKPVKLNSGLYLETDFSPDEFVSIVRVLMDRCNMDYDNVEIYYEVYRDADVDTVTQKEDVIVIFDEPAEDGLNKQPVEENQKSGASKIVITSVAEGKAAFENWLITGAGLAVRSAQSYTSAIHVAGQYSMRWGFSEKELFFILDEEQVDLISKKLLAKPEFAQFNEGQHNRYRAALSKYRDYCKVISDGTLTSVPLKDASVFEQENEIKKNRKAFIAWAQSQQMQKTAIFAYLSDIKKCSEFAKENAYTTVDPILLIEDSNELERIFLEMRKDHRFIELNNERQKRPVSAMNKLIAFRRSNAKSETRTPVISAFAVLTERVVQRPVVPIATFTIDPQVKERYTAILVENFVDGFRPTKAIDRNRFRMYYSDVFREELAEDDESLVCILMKVGIFRDERIFAKDEIEQKDLLEEINDTIAETFGNGASCIYLDCLFARFQEQLAEMLHIYNVDSLESVLFSSGKCNYFKRYNYLFGYSKEPAPNRDVIEYMKKSHLPVTYSEIENALWYIPLDKIKYTLVTTSGIVNVASEAYLYAPNLPVSECEIQQMMELIGQALLQRNYISDVELMQLIEEYCPSVLMNTPDYPMWGLRNALSYLLRDKFSFRGAIISDKDAEISMAEVFSDFCRRSERITVDELKQFASELNTVIYWDSVYSEMVRVNQNEFVRRDQIHFDIEQTDFVLDSLVQSDYTPIKTINLFLHFPTIDVPWNNFVLESYVGHYSKKFRLLHASYIATDCCGAIVRQDSGISNYRTLIVDVLTQNTGWENKKDALQLLVDLGYQQRRSYSDIEKVMQEAKAQMRLSKK